MFSALNFFFVLCFLQVLSGIIGTGQANSQQTNETKGNKNTSIPNKNICLWLLLKAECIAYSFSANFPNFLIV